MTDSKGNGVINTVFDDYGPYKGDIQYRKQGSLIAFEAGEAITYGLFNAQERGTLFIGPGEKVYSGMVVGQKILKLMFVKPNIFQIQERQVLMKH